jgi:hypothetical protein
MHVNRSGNLISRLRAGKEVLRPDRIVAIHEVAVVLAVGAFYQADLPTPRGSLSDRVAR